MKTRNLTIKSLVVAMLALLACDPEYPTPTPTNEYNSATGNAGYMLINVAQNSSALTLAVDNGTPIAASEVEYTERFPATSGYSSTIPAGSRNLRIFANGTSLLSTRPTLNTGSNSSFYVIGRADVTAAARADRARLIEFLAESLPAVPTGTPNTVHVRLLNFGLTAIPNPPVVTTNGTLGNIALRIDATSPTAAPPIPAALPTFTTNGTYFLPADQAFPIAAPAAGAPDWRTLAKSYASTTSPFTALTVPTVGGAGNNFVVDVVTVNNGNVVLGDVALNLIAGRVYTLALIGSNVVGEQPYQLLVIRHR